MGINSGFKGLNFCAHFRMLRVGVFCDMGKFCHYSTTAGVHFPLHKPYEKCMSAYLSFTKAFSLFATPRYNQNQQSQPVAKTVHNQKVHQVKTGPACFTRA